MELCDLLTNVHKKFLPNRTEKCPYYISTLQRNLHLTNISLSNDQVDNASNMNVIQNLIKSEVPEAKERVKWEKDYKSLQLRLEKLSSAVKNSAEQNKDKYLIVEKDVKVALKHVFLRRAHQRHENLGNWFQPEYDRIVSELQDIQQNLSS
ncbi:hypothetical protein B566_EDAN018814 [Ephemera danica]|nr:hypothetical protein B566_EDAN018814 [Ephemera danica]